MGEFSPTNVIQAAPVQLRKASGQALPYNSLTSAIAGSSNGDTIQAVAKAYDEANLLKSVTATITSIHRNGVGVCTAQVSGSNPFHAGDVIRFTGTALTGHIEAFSGFNHACVVTSVTASTIVFNDNGESITTTTGGIALGLLSYDFAPGAIVSQVTPDAGVFDDTVNSGINAPAWCIVRGSGRVKVFEDYSAIHLEQTGTVFDGEFDELETYTIGNPCVWVNNSTIDFRLVAKKIRSEGYDAVWIQQAKSFHIRAMILEGADQGAELYGVAQEGYLHADIIRNTGDPISGPAAALNIGNSAIPMGKMFVRADYIVGAIGLQYNHQTTGDTTSFAEVDFGLMEATASVGVNIGVNTLATLKLKGGRIKANSGASIVGIQFGTGAATTLILEDVTIENGASAASIDAVAPITVKVRGVCRATTAVGANVTLDLSGGGVFVVGTAGITITEAQVTNLTTDLAAKAPLASPTFTGTPAAPTAAASTSTTQLATTAFATTADNLKANIASPTFTGTPAAPTQSAGDSTTALATTAFVTTADNLKANIASPTFTGVPAAPTATGGTNTTQLATTAYVVTALGSYQPVNSNLTTIAGLTATTNNFIVSVASAWASRTPAQALTTLGIATVGTSGLASDLTGTLADARLSSNVPLLNAANTFTNSQTIHRATDAVQFKIQSHSTQTNHIFDIVASNGVTYWHVDDFGAMTCGAGQVVIGSDGSVNAVSVSAGTGLYLRNDLGVVGMVSGFALTWCPNSSNYFAASPDTDIRRTAAGNVMVTDAANSTDVGLALGRKSTTTASRKQAEIVTVSVDNTDATRKYRFIFNAYDTAAREVMRGEASGSAPTIGFLGASAVARPTVTGSRGSNAALASLITALANLGLVTDSSS